MSEAIETEIDALEAAIGRFRAGRLAEPVFTETRLRHGVYGQRQDGVHMIRIKLPLGRVGAGALRTIADVAETYGNGVAHLTTRQDVQFHFVALERAPELLRDLARVDVTAREACGNVVRNVTAGALSGVSPTEAFDVTPHGLSLASALLRHPLGQDLGRKFKVRLSGEADPALHEALFHDLGLVAQVRHGRRGFTAYVGGGLGAIPYRAEVLYEFLPEDELLEVALAILVVFGARGERRKRARARLKFLVADMGLDAFRAEVERARRDVQLERRGWLDHERGVERRPVPQEAAFPVGEGEDEARWIASNVHLQRQRGYAAVAIRVPRGDLSPAQLRGLAGLLDAVPGAAVRVDVDQNLVLRWVPVGRLREVRSGLVVLGLGDAGDLDPVTCPGADTCKLGITSPRSIAADVERALAPLRDDPRVAALRVHVSGCPNSCARHQIADVGLHGAARTVDGRSAPHYALVLGGHAGGEQFGGPHGKVPAARAGDAVGAIVRAFVEGAETAERFHAWLARVGRGGVREIVQPLTGLPPYAAAPALYREPGRDEAFAVRRGTGECAGEVVGGADLAVALADSHVDRALDAEEAGRT
ncbi:MAG: nitrite/sulfite reductase, partial [Planctomycetota bacterium]